MNTQSSPSSRRGSIAARSQASRRATKSSVVPVVTTGLHCGVLQLTHARLGPPQVVPVVTTGLHCGRAWLGSNREYDESSPSSRRGSIAAAAGT